MITPIPFSPSDRLSLLTKEAQALYGKMGGSEENKFEIKLDPQCDVAQTFSRNRVVEIHPLFLLNPEDIPIELRLFGPKDPKIEDPKYLRQWSQWLSKEFHIEEKKFASLGNLLRFYAFLWEKPEMLERIKRFALAHELGHYSLSHSAGRWNLFLSNFTTLVLTYILYGLLPLPALILLSILIMKISDIAFKSLRLYMERTQEFEADLVAIRVTKDFVAAKTLFELIDKHKKLKWQTMSFWSKLSTACCYPERVFPLSHPTPQIRIDYLKTHSFI